MVALPISLGLNHSLHEEDLFRALFCSIAVYYDNAEAQNFFQETLLHFPHITFDEVNMSLDVPDGQKILVAYCGNDVFIAFKGTESFYDVASNIMVNNQSQFGGSFHKGFFDRSCIFMASNRSDFNPLHGLLVYEKRVIFCGHSLGGAVAHMVLLRFWLEGGELPSRDTYPDSLFSIAFGAPHICNDKAAGIINNNENLKWRFITFVNQSDPVPLMLHHITRTISAGLQGLFDEADSVLQAMGGFLGCSIKGFGNGGHVGSGLNSTIRAGGRFVGKTLGTVVQQKILPSVGTLVASVASDSSSSEVPKKPDFHPIGQYICLVQEAGNWGVDTFFGDDLTLQAFLNRDLKFTNENLEQHAIGSYKSTLIAIYGSNIISMMPHQSPHLLVKTPAPKVTFAKWIIVDSVREYIKVRGENLLFLREAVSINGREHWRIVSRGQSEKELFLCRPSKRVSSQRINFLEEAVSHVIIKTAFGQTHHPILEDYLHNATDIGVSKMISKIVQALNVKATPSLSICPRPEVLDRLDDIMRCVPELMGKKISTELLKVTQCGNDLTGRSLENHCKEINHMLDLVGKYLKSSLKVEYFEPELLGNIRRGAHSLLVESGLTKAGTYMGAAFLAVDFVFGIPIGTTVLVASLVGNLILSPKALIFTEYEDVLKQAIEETSKWSKLDRTGANTNSGRELDDLEKELIEKVERSTPFKKMVEQAHSTSISTVPNLKSDLFQGATPESRLKLLKRIKLVYDTSYLYNLEVAGVHFMGIFGAEDAGKSTFIKKVLEKQFPLNEHLQVPKAGFDSHTKIVKPYKLNNSLWLVDFPGSDGAGPYADKWKQFTSLSSSSVLFLNFEYDVKDEQVQMYKEMKEKLGAQTVVTIVFNKVDERFTPRKQEQFSTQYFKNLKQKTETELGCTGCKDTVHFACVDPDIPHQDLTKLKGMGVLGFEELHNHLVASLMTKSSTQR